MEQSNEKEARSAKRAKVRCPPPPIDAYLQLKWGLALLGEEKSQEYLSWLREKLSRQTQ